MTDEPMVCEQCGAELDEREQQMVLHRGGPVVCAVHMAQTVETDEDSLGAQTEL